MNKPNLKLLGLLLRMVILGSLIVGLTGWAANAFIGNRKVEVWSPHAKRNRS